MAELVLTGERTLPGLARENYWFRRHEAAYAWAAHRLPVTGGTVIDAGSGEGYGAQLLAQRGASVVALEYDPAAASHSAAAYPAVSTVRANLDSLPLRAGSADVVVTMQVIEHLWDLPGFLRECFRVLRPGGAIVAATPNRLTFSPGLGRGQKPVNPFHVEEFDDSQIGTMLRYVGFVDIETWGVHHGERIAADLVGRQVAAALSGRWPEGLLQEVAAVTAADFMIGGDPATGLDIIGVGTVPVGK